MITIDDNDYLILMTKPSIKKQKLKNAMKVLLACVVIKTIIIEIKEIKSY